MFTFGKVKWQDALPSTQTALREQLLTQGAGPGTVIATLTQTAGRGRYERIWTSAPGRDLAFSFAAPADLPPEQLPSLPMACALGIVDQLDELGLREIETKWPNDVLCGKRKISGLLAERLDPPGAPPVILMGIGINVNMTEEEADRIDQPATSVRIETGHSHDVRDILPPLLTHLIRWIDCWLEKGFEGLRETWTQRCAYQGESITVRDGQAERTGRLKGFGDSGELLLATDSGLQEIWSGDLRPKEENN